METGALSRGDTRGTPDGEHPVERRAGQPGRRGCHRSGTSSVAGCVIAGLESAIDQLCRKAQEASRLGYSVLILSDRGVNSEWAPIPSLLALGAVHHHLVRNAQRTQIGIVLETGEAREVHHHCLLVGYGADAINPYIAFEALAKSREEGILSDDWTDKKIIATYRKGVAKGMLKVMGKMGISTLQSYKGAQIFEAVGIGAEVIDRCFAGTASRIGGVGFDVLADEALRRHEIGYPVREQVRLPVLPNPGEFQWRATGERHMWDPKSITDLQIAG
ncbi:MAG: glutamate synthase subunit alpha, partial [Candidatus Krumholzibacteriota bacterium]|nr:glutamate synthase subunit alpha [Candidatus Krumholzibacteriota bacterium]